MKDKHYNGHKNYNYWNVYLWINNDAGLYNMARDYVRHCKSKDEAARRFVEDMKAYWKTEKTPDGAPYTISAVRAAMVEM